MAPPRITPWTADEVQTFLRLVADDRIQHQLRGAARNAKVYKEVAALLAVRGYRRTFLQCREKLKKLKSDYRSIKEQKTGSSRKNWRWFEQLDAIYGDKPAGGGRTRLHDTVAGMLDALMEDDSISVSSESSMSSDDDDDDDDGDGDDDDATLPVVPAAAPPAPPPAPPARTPTANGRKRRREPEYVSVLKETLAADVEQQKLNRAQREQHFQKLLDDMRRSREQEAALRREEMAATAAFNQAFLSTLQQLTQVIRSRRDPE